MRKRASFINQNHFTIDEIISSCQDENDDSFNGNTNNSLINNNNMYHQSSPEINPSKIEPVSSLSQASYSPNNSPIKLGTNTLSPTLKRNLTKNYSMVIHNVHNTIIEEKYCPS